MKPGDYIELSDIKGPEHHQKIRDAVRAMGYRVDERYGTYEKIDKAKQNGNALVLYPDGDLTFFLKRQGNRINPDDLLGEPTPELPPVGEWQPWTGGECPVPYETEVIVMTKDGGEHVGWASNFNWLHDKYIGDIVAYKVVSYPSERKRVNIPAPITFFVNKRSNFNNVYAHCLTLVYKTKNELEDALSKLKEENNDE